MISKKLQALSVCIGAVIGLLLVNAIQAAAAPAIEQTRVADVTTRSFSVVWVSNEAATAGLQLFEDEDGGLPVTGSVVIPHPVASGSQRIKSAAEARGVMKVKATGLSPDTTYYFRTVTVSKDTGEATFHPASGPLPSVTTESATVRTRQEIHATLPFANDLIVQPCLEIDGVTPAEGALLVANVEGAGHPITAFAGDRIALPYAVVDLNNVFADRQHVNLDLSAEMKLTFLILRGHSDYAAVSHEVPEDLSLGQLKPPAFGLPAGWNLVSLMLEPGDPRPDRVLAPLADRLISAWGIGPTGDDWISYQPFVPPSENELVELHAGRAYWLHLSDDASLMVDGTPVAPVLNLDAGWNAVGFPWYESEGVEEIMAPISSAAVAVWSYDAADDRWRRHAPEGEDFLNDLGSVHPGTGYWLQTTQGVVWIRSD